MVKKLALLLAAMLLMGAVIACKTPEATIAQETQEGTAVESNGTPVSTEAPAKTRYAGYGFDATDNKKVVAYIDEPPSDLAVSAVPETLTAAQGGEPQALYPFAQNHIPSIIADRPMYETLIVQNQFTGEYEGGLAEKWEMIDSTTIRIYLRQGVKCHAGNEITTSDVLWSIQQASVSAKNKQNWNAFDVANCKIIDDYTIDIKTFEEFGPLLNNLAAVNHACIIDQQAYEAQLPDDYVRNPNGGTGPYKFVEWIAGDRIIYERFEDYWGEKPYFKNYVLRNIPDDSSRAMSLEAGEVDFVYGVTPASAQALIDSAAANLITCPSYQLIYVGFNTNAKPFDNVLVRKAMRYALDLDSMVNLAFSGYAIVSDSFLVPTLSAYSPLGANDEKYGYDLEKAKALLAEAGYPNGFEVELWTADTTAWMQLAEMMQNAWAQIGVTVNVTVMDVGTLWEKIETGEHQIYIARESGVSDEADTWRNKLYSTSDYYSNGAAYKSAIFDELMDKARATLDTSLRMQYYAGAQAEVRKDLPWIPSACPMICYGVRSTLKGVEPHPYGTASLATIRPISED